MDEKLTIKRSPRAYWEGNGRKVLMVPNMAISKLISHNALFNTIYVTDMGYYPKAASHYMLRKKGSPENIIFYCYSGKGWFETPQGRFEVNPNQFFILPDNQLHFYGADANDPWSIYWIMFSGRFSKEIAAIDKIDDCFKPTSLFHCQKFLDLFNETFNALSEGYTFSNLLFANMNLWEILMLFIHQVIDRNKNRKDLPMEQIINYMKKNITKKITVREMASIISCSPSRFYSLFKSQVGYSPIDYFIHLKVQSACNYLNTTNLRIKEIAPLVGYEDQYLFTRNFKKNMGMSPKSYREQTRLKV
jgi:AraC-like DNA-binding protein